MTDTFSYFGGEREREREGEREREEERGGREGRKRGLSLGNWETEEREDVLLIKIINIVDHYYNVIKNNNNVINNNNDLSQYRKCPKINPQIHRLQI